MIAGAGFGRVNWLPGAVRVGLYCRRSRAISDAGRHAAAAASGSCSQPSWAQDSSIG